MKTNAGVRVPVVAASILSLFWALGASVALAASPPDGWRITLDASVPGLSDKGRLTLGAGTGASDGFDAFDDPHPPALASRYVDAVTVHSQNNAGWATQPLASMRYRAEYGTPLAGSARTLNFQVDTDQASPMTLTWRVAPDLDLAEHFLTLRDLATGATVDMWAQTSYMASGAAGSHAFRIEMTAGRTAPPVAYDQAVATNENVQLPLTLTAVDPKGNPLTYSLVDPAQHGTVLGAPPAVTYVPNQNYYGQDAFTFVANNGQTLSNVAQVSITVNHVNQAPVADSQPVTTDENTPASITLAASDVDGDPLTYVVGQPQHGTLSGTAPNLTYTPALYYSGSDAFTFKANDGKLDSNTASVSITVNHVNQAPLVNFTVPGPAWNSALWRNNIASANEGATIVSASGQLNASWVAQNAIDDAYATGWGVSLPGPANLVMQLPRGEIDHFDRIRLVINDTSSGVNHFEIWVSTTTADAAAFTKVYSGATQVTYQVQEFALPSPVDARYVKFVALDNHGGTTFIALHSLELIRSDKAGLPSYLGSNVASISAGATLVASTGTVNGQLATQALDGNVNTLWQATQAAGPSLTVQLTGGQSYRVDRVRLMGLGSLQYDVKNFRVAVSNTTSDPASFTTVLDATAQATTQIQEFVFPGGAVDARYVKLSILSNSGNYIQTSLLEFEAVAADGVLSSYARDGGTRPENMLMEGGSAQGWMTAPQHVSNEFVKVALAQGGQLIDRVRLQQANGGAGTDGPKDFEIRISTTDLRDASFTTVLSATAANSPGHLQEFVFPGGAVRARYVELFVKNNYGSTQDIRVQWFQAVTVESQSNAVSYPAASSNVLRLGSPAATVNGGKVVAVSSVYPGNRLDLLLGYGGYGYGLWQTTSKTGQYLTIELAGSQIYTVRGVRIGAPNGSNQTVKNFEIWVSTTTTDAAAFTKVFAGTVLNNATEQGFLFPPAQARYVKYVPLSNYGDPTYIATAFFDVVTDEAPGVVDNSPPGPGYLAESALSGLNYVWYTGSTTNQWIKVNLGAAQKVYGVRVNASLYASPKDYDIRVSTTTPDDASFTTVLSGTLAASASVQTLYFPGGVTDAKYVEFFFKNAYSATPIIYRLEVLAATAFGANVTGYSSASASYPVENALDANALDLRGWQTPAGEVANQWFSILLPQARVWTIDHVALEASWPPVRDFEIQVSTTTQDAAAFTTAFAGTVHNELTHFSGTLQHFFFPPVPARYVRLFIKSGWGTGYISLAAFRVFSPEIGSVNARFLDRSVDVDGQIVSRSWAFGDGGWSNALDPSHVYAAGGTYDVNLSATDNEGAVGTLTRGYTALGPPTADFTWAPNPPQERQWFTVTDTSTAGDGDILSREWDFGDGGTAAYTAPTANHAYLDSGDYPVTLRVTDRWGSVATKTQIVSVLNMPPVIVMPTARVAIGGILTTFKPTVTDQGADPFTCVWDFGDGSAPTNPSADCTFSHTYVIAPAAPPQVFTATLTATDKDGGVATASVATTVRQPCLAGPKGTAQKAVSGTLYYSRFSMTTDFNVKMATFNYDGTAFTIGAKTGIAHLPDADGLMFAPDGDLIVGSRVGLAYKVNPGTGTYTSATSGGVRIEHVNMDPDRKRFWGTDLPDDIIYTTPPSLAEFPLDPAFGPGTARPLMGEDNFIATIGFDGCGNGYYTRSELGNGPFGLIDMTSFNTGRVVDNLPAAHGIAYDPLTATLFLFGGTHITQIDPKTLAIVSDRAISGDVGFGIDQGSVDGKGHAFAATTGTNLIFVDYSATGKVGDPSNYVATVALDTQLDDIAPMIGLGSPNHAPEATGTTLGTAKDQPVSLTLSVYDADGDPLTYVIVTAPTHGTLTGSGPSYTYTPQAGFVGTDSFSFKANDGKLDSNIATMTLAVTNPPVANAQSVSTAEDTAKAITLTATDADADPLTYAIATPPQHGTLTGTPSANVTYTPAANYNGPDSFTFKANDGHIDSAPATVTITVTAVNDAPVANPQSVTTAEDTATTFALTATDLDGDALTYAVATAPSHGTVTLNGANATYTPAANYNGPDSFTFTAKDASLTSAPATVSITVTAVNDAPTATPQSVTTAEDTAKAITLAATDVEGNALTYAIATPPTHGTLAGTPPTVTYTPATNYNGSDSFTFTARDASLTSAPATVTVNITPVNDAPAATAQSVTTAEDTATVITLSGTDVDGDSLTYTVATQPGHGTLSGTGSSRTYTPAANYNGPDSFTFTAKDAVLTSAAATVSITVTPVNDAPVATGQPVTTAEDTPKAITLSASDVDGDALTYTIVTAPLHGTVTGTPSASVTYTPAANYNGSDSFTFKASDASLSSAAATVTITVTAVNDAPVANPQSVTTAEDTAKAITLSGTDVEGSTLTYAIATQPAHGTLSGTGASRTYTPSANYNGADSFSFTVNDGALTSTPATVSISVTPVNDAPSANPQTVRTPLNTAVGITLTGTDPDNDPLTYTVVAAPTHGTLAGSGASRTYTPNTGYAGSDSFTFKVNDGTVDSPTAATVSIVINAPPVAQAQSKTTNEDTAVAVTLAATDANGDALTYAVVTAPAHGTLTGTPPNLTYTPAANFNGPDSFTFKANDGLADSNVAAVSLTITAVNDAPVASPQSVATLEDTALAITLAASDAEGSPLTYAVVTAPAHGTLSGTAPSLTYTPALNYNGSDSFTFKANDGALDSAVATVTITITAVNDPPVANNQAAATPLNTAVTISLTATDVEGDPLTYAIVTPPAHGTLTGSGASRTYTPATGYAGTDTFTFKANDGKADSNVATATISVAAGPVCTAATANPSQVVWSPKHLLVAVQVQGVVGTGVTIQATSVFQDEPTNGLGDGDKTPDATLSPLQVRGERSGQGDGRIYHINFKATDSGAKTCTGTVTVCVPNDGGGTTQCVDGGSLYDSTK